MPLFLPQYDYQLRGGYPRNLFFGFFPHAKVKSFTAINLILIFIYFLITVFYSYFTKITWTCTLYNFGAHFQPAIVENYQMQREITPLLLHSGIPHIMMNSISLLIYGFVLEDYYGKFRFIFLYLLTGICGNLLSGLVM